jgi:osmotically-inducible protein OsmY
MATAARLGCGSVLLGFIVAAAAGAEARVVQRPDAWITIKTKIALVVDKGVASSEVHVDTVDGRITLYGRVNAESQKQGASAVAHTIEGERGVRNLLQVVPPSGDMALDQEDDLIKHRVEEALEGDTGLADSDISVKSVESGCVLLSGTAKTLSAQLSALETAARAPGVHGVSNGMQAPGELTEAETSRFALGTTESTSDTWTTADVKLRLLADGNVPALEVSVDTDRGVVSLFGLVPTTAARSAAVADAQKAGSVVSVLDDLQVTQAADRRELDSSDAVVKRNIKAAFKTCPELQQVDVQVRHGRAHLIGTVASECDRLHAAIAARETRGVRSVDDDLHLARPRG